MKQLYSKYLLAFPVHIGRGENIVKYINIVKDVESAPLSAVTSYQNKLLRDVLIRACQYGYYDDKTAASLIIGKVNSENASNVLADVPPLSKNRVNTLVDHENHFGLDFRSTSGSTGKPLKFYKDRLSTGFMEAVAYHAFSWHGISIGAPQARFWGKPLGGRGQAIATLKDVLKNRVRFSAFDLSPEAKKKFLDKLVSFRPEYFYGYPSLIHEYCRYLEQNKGYLNSMPLKAVIGTGEYTYNSERSYIENVTGVQFFNEYGCTETGIIGFECENRKLHLMVSNIYLEIIKNGKRVVDEEGDIYITELNSRYKPFIRYELGDRGVLLSGKCSCGRQSPIFEIVAGRKDDFILTPEGKKVYDAIFAYTLKKGIEQFKAVQIQRNFIEVKIIVNNDYSPELELKYIDILQKQVSRAITFQFVKVEVIARETSGKLRYFTRECN